MKTIIILSLCLGSLLGYDVYTTKDEIALRRAYSFEDLEKCSKEINEKCINQFDDLLIKELNAIK